MADDDTVAQRSAEDLERLGLVAHSYDSLFAIRKVIRKINDIPIPFRGGLGTNQIGVAFLVFIAQIMLYGLVVLPLMSLLRIAPHPGFMLIWLLAPPILVGQRIAKPMAYGKSIGSTFTSFLRRHLDDPVHRRGIPVKNPAQPDGMPVLHYQREWEMFADYAELAPGEADVTDDITEARFASQAGTVDLQRWYDDQAINHHRELVTARNTRTDEASKQVRDRRGRAARVNRPEPASLPDD